MTGVILLSVAQSQELGGHLDLAIGENAISPRLAITSSLDCCLKLWNIDSGSTVASIYTYSSITAVCYVPAHLCCIVGSEGGKLEVYSFNSQQNNPLYSIHAFDEAVSSIKVSVRMITNLECWLKRERGEFIHRFKEITSFALHSMAILVCG